MDQCGGTGSALVQSLLQRIAHEVRMYGAAYAPVHDASGKDVDVEGHVAPALPSQSMGEVRPAAGLAVGP